MATTSKVVLILGAGSRVGEHVARTFASQGYKVASTSRSAKETDDTSEAIHIAADLSDPQAVAGVFFKVKNSLGVPSVVVYNAAAATPKDAKNPASLSIAEFTKSLSVNTTSAYAAVQEAVQGFEQLPHTSSRTFIYTGNILNTTVMPALLDLGVGKAATAHIIQAAATAYSNRGFKFYYADERKSDGSPSYNAIDGEAHGQFYAELAEAGDVTPKSEKEAANESVDENEDDEEEEEEEEYEPPYTVEELAKLFLDFYKFLATLHYDPSDLKIPPPEGWAIESLPAAILKRKSTRVVELMRRLPYFREGKTSTHVHYKSKLVDYSDPAQHYYAGMRDDLFFDLNDKLESFDGETVDPAESIVFAWGYESGGHYFALDALHGEVTVDVVRMNLLGPEDVKEFFENLKKEYRDLKLVPCPGRETIEAEGVDEREGPIEQSEVMAQTQAWGTNLDWQFVRQIYREHGWVYAFRRVEAIRAIEKFMALKSEERGEWETAYL
ncbi:hypothetical protein SLS60_010446 [Paraconiothyrium brasiliense]|uniref:Uncharacterized protein n=1 Tax=Paraconiothyrium brasiliense TaxID=300254 RepID=A0ABR3QP94_9PLEO